VLKDAVGARYFRLTERGLFVWDALDGMQTVREVLLAYWLHFADDGTPARSALRRFASLDSAVLSERLDSNLFSTRDPLRSTGQTTPCCVASDP